MKQLPEKKNRGFTLVEMTVVLAIFAILLAVLVPSLDPVAGFRANRAASSIGAALDRTKTEALDRLVGEMKLSWTSDGYYISYYLDRGKTGVKEEQPEKIASGRMKISYTDSNGTTVNLWEDGTNQLILTYDRSTGGFLPIQSRVWEQKDILKMLSDGEISLLTVRKTARSLIVKRSQSMAEDRGHGPLHCVRIQENIRFLQERTFHENRT